MKKNAIRGYIVLAILLAVYCAVAFLAPFARTATFWIGFGFGAFALLFQLYVIHTFSDGDARSRFYGFPVVRLGVYYLVAQLILSLIEMALAKLLPMWIPLLVNAVLAAAALIGCITVETMRDEIARQDVKLKKDVSAMRELQSLAAALVAQCPDDALKPALRKLADEFRYSDPVSSEATRDLEGDLRSQLADLQQALVEGDAEDARKLCGKLTGSLAERNRVCAVSK